MKSKTTSASKAKPAVKPAAKPETATPKAKAKAKPAAKAATPASTAAPLVIPKGVLIGSHTSTAGGVGQAIVRAKACGFTAAQIFVKNNKQWFAPPISDTEAAEFRKAQKAANLYIFAHNSYLVNLGSQNPQMFATSIKAMTAELERAEALQLPFIVMHPGSHGGAGEEAGQKRIVQGLDEIVEATKGFKCKMALEITAGQGNALGYQLEQLDYLIQSVRNETRFGICLDTAHLYAAGYNIRTREGYDATFDQVEKLFSVKRVLGLHLNDSKKALGSRVDRHDQLGDGEIGIDCFKWLVQDPRWAGTPMVLETPKSEDMHEDIDNLQKLAPYLQSIA